MNKLLDKSRHLPVGETRQTISISPVTLSATQRGQPLEMRITAPLEGGELPIILLSHGDGPSLYLPSKDGYGPLANFYAEQGFAVIQPTHANSKVAGLSHDLPGAPLFWRSRVDEMKLILDNLSEIERMIPTLSGRLDHGKIAAVGHSMGGQTVGMLLGARLTDSRRDTDHDVSVIEPRIKVGVLLAPPGNGGDELSDFARENFTELNPDYSHLITKSLVVVGDADVNPFMTVRGPEWYTAAYRDGPGCDSLLTLIGGMHGLGGIAGYDAKETGDENPDRLAIVQRMTAAYLHSALYNEDAVWGTAREALARHATDLAHVESKCDRPSP
ncbi:MAG: chlorophyllase [Cyanobacteria bacterium J06639_16]